MLEKLSYSLGRRDEEPDIELAVELAETKNRRGIKEIVEGLGDKREQIANDCIKVLYEIGYREPSLISDHAGVFLSLLTSRNNRLVWGAMTAISTIASENPEEIFDKLELVIKAYEKGSVITVDSSISVFAGLVLSGDKYAKKVWPVIIKHLETCRPKEVAQHAERAFVCVNEKNAGVFKKTLEKRLDSLSEPQLKRVNKLLKKVDVKKFG